jgi:hypothetical protein
MFTIKVWPNTPTGNVTCVESDWFTFERVEGCHVSTFGCKVKGEWAYINEFGRPEYDVDKECRHCHGIKYWIPEDRPEIVEALMKKFNLTYPEWQEIQAALTQLMPFHCRGCISDGQVVLNHIARRACAKEAQK